MRPLDASICLKSFHKGVELPAPPRAGCNFVGGGWVSGATKAAPLPELPEPARPISAKLMSDPGAVKGRMDILLIISLENLEQ